MEKIETKRQGYLSQEQPGDREKREELSVSATKSIKKEKVEIILKFS